VLNRPIRSFSGLGPVFSISVLNRPIDVVDDMLHASFMS
jgi:hypothetical protein